MKAMLPDGMSIRVHADTNDWGDMKKAHPDLEAETHSVRINGRGHETPVATAPVLVEIVWKTPGEV